MSSLCGNVSGLKDFQFAGKYNWFGFKDLANPLKAGAPRESVSVRPVLLSILFKASPILPRASHLDCFAQSEVKQELKIWIKLFLAALAALCPPLSVSDCVEFRALQTKPDQTRPNLPDLPTRLAFLTHLKYLAT